MINRYQQKKIFARIVIALSAACFLLLIAWVGQILFPPKIPTKDDPVHFYSNQVGKDIKEALLHSMEEAKKSILVIVYTLNDDEVMETLKQKSDEGLEVKVLVDKSGYRKGKNRIGKNTTLIKRKGKGLMHEKVVVVDKELVWLGSTNFTTTAFALHDNLMQAIWHPPLAEKLWERSNMMTPKGQPPLFTPYAFQAGENSAELWITPNPIDAPKKLEKLIDSAKKTLKIALFTWTHKDLAKKVTQAKDRGIDVTVILDADQSKQTNKEVLKKLYKRGIKVGINTHQGTMHHKFMLIDGETLVHGSLNWTKAAFAKNDDLFMIVENLDSGQQILLNKLYLNLETNAKWINDEDWINWLGEIGENGGVAS